MYTLRNFMQTERDMRRTLKQVADIGYMTVQISGTGPIDPHVLREICDENGLKIVLTHIPETRFLEDIDGVIRDHDILGCDYIGLGSMPQRYYATAPEWVRHFADDFLTPAKKIRDAGKLFMYHNHNFEFERMPDGKILMDKILDMFPADVMGITLDTYWLQAGGCDLYDWFDRLKNRIPCIHFKDMTVKGTEIRMAPVGGGNINFPALLAQLEKQGGTKYVLVEQDNCYDQSPFECLQQSYDHLAKCGYR